MEMTIYRFEELEVGRRYHIGHGDSDTVIGVLKFKGRDLKRDSNGCDKLASFEISEPNNFLPDFDGLVSFDMGEYPPPLKTI